jgi:hypothetical protein
MKKMIVIAFVMGSAFAACGKKAAPAAPAAPEMKTEGAAADPCAGKTADPCGGAAANPCGGAANPCAGK